MRDLCLVFIYTMLMLSVSGCAYVEYRRVYDAVPFPDVGQTVEAFRQTSVGTALEQHFLQKGYTLKEKYHDFYPVDQYVSILEIPRTSEQKRRRPLLLISVRENQFVRITQSEWFLGERPEDVVGTSKEDLARVIKDKTGIAVELDLREKGYY